MNGVIYESEVRVIEATVKKESPSLFVSKGLNLIRECLLTDSVTFVNFINRKSNNFLISCICIIAYNSTHSF